MSAVVNKTVAIAACHPHPRNYNAHSDTQLEDLRESLRQFGQVRSIVVQKNSKGYTVIAGHGVLEAAKREGFKTIKADIIPAAWSKSKALAYLAADNELARRASPDQAQLDALVREVLDSEGEVLARLAAGEQAALDRIIAEGRGDQEEPVSADELIDRSDEIQEKWHCAMGDTWVIGSHQLFCCDSEKKFAKLVNGIEAKVVFTDPPYGINVVSNLTRADGAGKPITFASGTIRARGKQPFRGKKTMLGTVGSEHWVDATPYKPVRGDDKPFDPVWLLKLAPRQIIWGGNYFASKLEDSRCWIVWNKNNTGNFADAELAWTNFEKGVRLYSHTWNGLVRAGERRIEGKRRLHPTQKPATLCAEIIRDFTDEGDVVFDPYAGSGSTLIACEMTRRVCYAAEYEPSYCAVTLERLANLGLTPQRVTQ